MKYQSELIKEIVDTRGHEKSSLHYESECIESWVKEVEGAYPKLCDYQSEWLNYIIENPIGDFPYETVTNVTEATVNNVVPYAYKSAILKGQTLVNLLGELTTDLSISHWSEDENNYTLDLPTGNGQPTLSFKTLYTLPANKTYTLFINMTSHISGVLHIDFRTPTLTSSSSNQKYFGTAGWQKLVFTTPEESTYVRMYNRGGVNNTYSISKSLILLEGDHTNTAIPNYFTGMQSVQMPVLTVTGKNLFDMNNTHFISGLIHNSSLTINSTPNTNAYYIACEPNTSYTITKGLTSYFRICETTDVPTIGCKVSNLVNNPSKTSLSITTSESAKYLCFNIHNRSTDAVSENEILATLQIEKGLVATSYEPYKSNTLTVNEEVTLRGIGDVKDELDCLTGEKVERIGEIVFDGSENWKWHSGNKYFWLNNKNAFNASGTNTIADKVKILGGGANFPQVPQFDDNINTIDSFKQWLSQNPITVQYQLATPTIKTVDLSIQDQDGNALRKIKPIEGTMHIHSDGTPLKPTITMEIPVEATTQNLASFIKEE